MQFKSKALEANLATFKVEVALDPRYQPLQEVMARYHGLQESLHAFLLEVSHPYKNWKVILQDARGYALGYFHLLKTHPQGAAAAGLYIDLFLEAFETERSEDVRIDAADHLLQFLQQMIREGGAAANVRSEEEGVRSKEQNNANSLLAPHSSLLTLKEVFDPLLTVAWQRISDYGDADFFIFVKSFYQIKRLAELYAQHGNVRSEEEGARSKEQNNANSLLTPHSSLLTPKVAPSKANPAAVEALNRLVFRYYAATYAYWLTEADPQTWFENEMAASRPDDLPLEVFEAISHQRLRAHQAQLQQLADGSPAERLVELLRLPGYNQIVDGYRKLPAALATRAADRSQGNQWKLIGLFHIINIAGLAMMHEDTLREVNRTLTWLIGHESYHSIYRLIEKTFAILQARSSEFPATTLNCILNMGHAVYATGDRDMVEHFICSTIALGFQSPHIESVGNDWQVKANTAHLQNIRTWLALIELNPQWSLRLLSSLIIHLSLSGILIKDTDLFPRNVTSLLNSPIAPVYNLVKQLTRLLPVFFNDIGAEGELRDISTELDELSHRKDVLVHFLRKQSHVESSNRILDFMAAAVTFWQQRDREVLAAFLPPSIFSQIFPEGACFEGMHLGLRHLAEQGLSLPEDLLRTPPEALDVALATCEELAATDRRRIRLFSVFYRLLNHKYNLGFAEIDHCLDQLKNGAFMHVEEIRQALAEKVPIRRLEHLLGHLETLKALILTPQTFDVREDIYRKRHITVDIPSMYGSYHELKFDALGLTFRLEALVNVLFEELISKLDLGLITKATFYEIGNLMRLFEKALSIDGLPVAELQRQQKLLADSLEVRGFTFTQYLDIFKGFAQAVKNIINDCFNNTHEQNLTEIVMRLPRSELLPKYRSDEAPQDTEKNLHRISEIFFRDRLATSLGLQQLDRFLTIILNTLFHQSEELPQDKLHLLLLYDAKLAVASLQKVPEMVYSMIYLGNKGFNLVQLDRFDLPIPPGFVITTEVFRCKQIIEDYAPAADNFHQQIDRQIAALEQRSGKRLGDPDNPLLLSVRSGSSISQPGMMDTFLDVGINESIVHGMARSTGNAWFAWDNYRRFLQGYGMALGMDRDHFDALMGDFKSRFGIPFKRDFSGAQMQEVALAYKLSILDAGFEFIDDPLKQLHMTIKSVMDSWNTPKARAYRKIMGISDDWGTAVTVQSMVFGNLSPNSGTGVVFTHNPRWSGDSIRLWGDFTLLNQGEDVVSGLVKTLPISILQQETEMRETDITLETHFPHIYNALHGWVVQLIDKIGWSPQELEFTFESPSVKDLYLLQTRDMAMRERKIVPVFDSTRDLEEKFLGHGIAVSGGAMAGRIVFSLEEIDHWRVQEPATMLILVRADTVPDDIREIHAADGLLTARGGLTSHAAVVAHRLGKSCVVGCSNLICHEKEKFCTFNRQTLYTGDHISIDGREGSVFMGVLGIVA